MNTLSTTATNLPLTIPELSRFVLVERDKLQAVRAEIHAIEKVGLAREVREQKLQEAQEIAEVVTDDGRRTFTVAHGRSARSINQTRTSTRNTPSGSRGRTKLGSGARPERKKGEEL